MLVPAAAVGRTQSGALYQAWPNSVEVSVRAASILARENPGRYLAEDYDVPAYYLERPGVLAADGPTPGISANVRRGTSRPLIGAGQPTGQRSPDHYFSLIILDFGDTAATDKSIAADITRTGDYQVIAELPYWDKLRTGQFTVWGYQPAKAAALAGPAPATAAHRPHSPRRNHERQH